MRTIVVYVTTGYVGSKNEDEFEVEDDATEEEISEMAEEYISQLSESGWYEKEEKETNER